MRSPHIWHVPCPQRKIMFFRRSKQTGHIVCSLMSCSCCCNFCMSELDVSRLPLFIRHTGSTGTPPVKQSSRHVTQCKWDNIHKHHTYRSQTVRGTQQLKLFYPCARYSWHITSSLCETAALDVNANTFFIKILTFSVDSLLLLYQCLFFPVLLYYSHCTVILYLATTCGSTFLLPPLLLARPKFRPICMVIILLQLVN